MTSKDPTTKRGSPKRIGDQDPGTAFKKLGGRLGETCSANGKRTFGGPGTSRTFRKKTREWLLNAQKPRKNKADTTGGKINKLLKKVSCIGRS